MKEHPIFTIKWKFKGISVFFMPTKFSCDDILQRCYFNYSLLCSLQRIIRKISTFPSKYTWRDLSWEIIGIYISWIKLLALTRFLLYKYYCNRLALSPQLKSDEKIPCAYLFVSAWLTLIPCSSNIAKYSERDIVPFPSLSI